MARWTAEVFVNSDVGTIHPVVEAGTHHGAQQQIERIYGPVTQIVNLRQINERSGGSGSSSEPGGCGGVLLLIIGAIVVGAFAGGGDDTKRPSTPPESLSQPQSRVAEPYTPPAPETYSSEPWTALPPRPDVFEESSEPFDIRDQHRNGRDR